jgi:peptidoglycan/LPS O-acetylase OafA/YrhL
MRSAVVLKQSGVSGVLRFSKGIAILLIAFHHFARSLWLARGVAIPNLMQWRFLPSGENFHQAVIEFSAGQYSHVLLRLFAQFGYFGVHIFILMSGLGLAFGTPSTVKPGAFIQRRFRKLIPPFWTAVVFFTVFRIIIGQPYTVREILERATLLTTFDQARFFSIDPPLWCLAVFFQLYVLFLPVRWLISRYGPRVILALAAIGFAARWITCLPPIANWNVDFGHALGLNWLAVFGIGVWAGDRLRNEGQVEIPMPVFAGSMLIASITLVLSETFQNVYPIHDSAIAVVACGTVFLIYRALSSTFVCRLVAFVGMVSFPLYLYHRPIIGIIVFFLRKDLGSGALEPLSIGVLSVASLICFFLLTLQLGVRKPRLIALALGAETWIPQPSCAPERSTGREAEEGSLAAAANPAAQD